MKYLLLLLLIVSCASKDIKKESFLSGCVIGSMVTFNALTGKTLHDKNVIKGCSMIHDDFKKSLNEDKKEPVIKHHIDHVNYI